MSSEADSLAAELIARGTDPTLAAWVASVPVFQQVIATMRDPEHLRNLEAKRHARRREGRGDSWGLSVQIQTARKEQGRIAKPLRSRPTTGVVRARQSCTNGNRRPAHRSAVSTRGSPAGGGDDDPGGGEPAEPEVSGQAPADVFLPVGLTRPICSSVARIGVPR